MDHQDRIAHAFGSAFNLFGEEVGPPAESMLFRQLRQRQDFFANRHMPRTTDYFEGGHSLYENRAAMNLRFFGDLRPQIQPGGEPDHQYGAVCPDPGSQPVHRCREVCPISREVEVSEVHSDVEDPRPSDMEDLRPSDVSDVREIGPQSEPRGEYGSEMNAGVEQSSGDVCGILQEAEKDSMQDVHLEESRNRQTVSTGEPEAPPGLRSLQSEEPSGKLTDTPSATLAEGHELVSILESEVQSINMGTEVLDETTQDLVCQYPLTEEPRPLSWKSSLIGLFTIQCARCFKWRLIPTRETYESIREHILETPWFCEKATQWRREAHCGLPPDILQDSQVLWAMDKPNLPAAPSGWQRKIVIRRDTSSRFADVYYTAPTGRVLRSMPDVLKYLENLALEGQVLHNVTPEKFSFTAPRPLPGVWTSRRRKRNAPTASSTAESFPDSSQRVRNL